MTGGNWKWQQDREGGPIDVCNNKIGGCAMKEEKIKKARNALEFEGSGETLAIEIEIINVPPGVKQETISSMLDTLYEKAKQSIF